MAPTRPTSSAMARRTYPSESAASLNGSSIHREVGLERPRQAGHLHAMTQLVPRQAELLRGNRLVVVVAPKTHDDHHPLDVFELDAGIDERRDQREAHFFLPFLRGVPVSWAMAWRTNRQGRGRPFQWPPRRSSDVTGGFKPHLPSSGGLPGRDS